MGHGDHERFQPVPKRTAGLQAARVIAVSAACVHVLALTQDGIHVWGSDRGRAVLGDPSVEFLPTPTPVEALQHIRATSIAAAGSRSHAVTDTGEVWAWGMVGKTVGTCCPVSHGDEASHPLPRPIEALRGVRVDAVAGSFYDTLALADDGSVYVWGTKYAAKGSPIPPAARGEGLPVLSPVRIPALRAVARGTQEARGKRQTSQHSGNSRNSGSAAAAQAAP